MALRLTISLPTLLAVICGGVLLAGPEALAKRPPKQAPIWRVDLRTLGYQRPSWTFYREGLPDSSTQPPPLSFAENNVVVTTFLTRQRGETLARRACPDCPGAFRLHAVFLDTTTGEVRATREWSTSSFTAGVIATSDGKFVFRTGDRIVLYSPELEPLKELTLPWVDEPEGKKNKGEYWDHFSSLSGRSILLKHIVYGEDEYQWIDATTLESVRSWTGKPLRPSISDNALADREVVQGGMASEVWLRELDGPWKRICAPPPNCGSPYFVNDEMLVLVRTHGLRLIRTAGQTLFTQQFEYKDWLHEFAAIYPSANGRRFAVAVTAKKGGSVLFDIMPSFPLTRVMVFDIPSRRWIYTLDAKRQKIKKSYGIALSPDGSLLGILQEDGILEVYRIPGPESEPAAN